jgi:HPt (histidine-containing phosphotransfer) domain-containing protein
LDVAALDQIRALQRPDMPDLVTRLIDLFLAEAPAVLAGLRRALSQGDRESVRRAAHRFKSGSANLGARDLADLCQALEDQAAKGDWVKDPDCFARIEAEYRRVAAALQRERSP